MTASAESRGPAKISPRPVRTLVAHTNTWGTPLRCDASSSKSTSRASRLRNGLMSKGLICAGASQGVAIIGSPAKPWD